MTNEAKVAIVTGAGQGIGRGIALKLATDGFNIVVSDINLETAQDSVTLIKEAGHQAIAVETDVSQKSSVDSLVSETIKTFGRLDVLVNNAGIFPFVSFADMTEADWDKVLNTNLKSVFLCSQAAAKVMAPDSRIISVSSIASVVGYRGLTHYCASKSGINGLVRALALELAPKRITVNAVAPGATATPGAHIADENLLKQTIATIPLGRMGTPEDIAAAVSYFASTAAGFVTGQVLVVDGGSTIQ